jgi:hypothetical protein
MSNAKSLYDEDFFLWSREQAEALRAAAQGVTNQSIDWDNVAEEIEGLGRSDKRELSSQIRRIIEHLLKLELSLATDPRAGRIASITDARNQVDVVIDDSPSLRNQVGNAIAAELKRASRKVVLELEQHGELDPATLARIRAATYTAEQVLGDWFPPDPEPDPPPRE